MPIKIPGGLPGQKVLEAERVPLILEPRALRQDIRPLQVAILNLMPDKARTETQLLRALGLSPLQIEITLLHASSHKSKNTPAEHLTAFYRAHEDVRDRNFDALIVTGAPVEHLAYEEVTYWDELARVLDWAEKHVYSSFFICWGAMAAMHRYHGVPKHSLPGKQSGIYRHAVVRPFHPLVAGFDNVFDVPVSRNTEVRAADIAAHPGLEVLVSSDEAGVCVVNDDRNRRVYVFSHLEYDAETIKREYERDKAAGLGPALPRNYFPGDDPAAEPGITWRAHRSLLFGNWINMVYQGTPYDLAEIGK